MKIASVKAIEVDVTPHSTTKPRVPKIETNGFVSPMQRYPDLKRSDWRNTWKRTACIVTAEDGTWGFGLTLHSGVTGPLINDHLGPLVEGENCMATERIWDLMEKATSPYGTAGIASFAISAVDNALWDLRQAARQARLRADRWTAERKDLLLRQRHRHLIRHGKFDRMVPRTRIQGRKTVPAGWSRLRSRRN